MGVRRVGGAAVTTAERQLLKAEGEIDRAWDSGDPRRLVRASERRLEAELELARARERVAVAA